MPKFKPGDIVRLKSSGPAMTVESLTNPDSPAPGYWCTWFSGAKDNKRNFAEAALIAVDVN